MQKKFWNSEKILSISAMLVSLCTLIVFIYQTNLIRKEQYLSVFPYLSLGHSGINTDTYSYVLKNDGIGPALITHISIQVGDSTFQEDLPSYLGRTKIKADSIDFYYSNISPGRLVPEKEEIEIISSRGGYKVSNKIYDKIVRDSVILIIEYESIYGEKWRVSGVSASPIKLN